MKYIVYGIVNRVQHYRRFCVVTDIEIDGLFVHIGSTQGNVRFEVFLSRKDFNWLEHYVKIVSCMLPEAVQKYIDNPFFEIDVRKHFGNGGFSYEI